MSLSFSRRFEWGDRLEKTIEIFQELLAIGEFDVQTLSRWMFGGSIKKGYMNMGVIGQIFYGEFILESLNHQLKNIFSSLSPLQREQVERFVKIWEIDNSKLLRRVFEESKMHEKEDFSFKADRIIYRAMRMETSGINLHSNLVEKAKNSTNLFYKGVSERSWEGVKEAVREALEGYIIAGTHSSLLRMKTNLAAVKAIELKKNSDLIAGDPLDYGEELVKILFSMSHDYGFGSDWVAATVFDYPSIFSRIKAERDDWPSTPGEWLSTAPNEVYVKEILMSNCATLVYANRCYEMMGGLVEGLEHALCKFCTAFWERLGEKLGTKNSSLHFSLNREELTCKLLAELRKKV